MRQRADSKSSYVASPFELASSTLRETLDVPLQVLAAFFSTSTVGLAICDRKFRYVAINDALAKMNGIPTRSHRGKTIRQILGRLAPAVEGPLRRVIATGRPLINHAISGVLPTRRQTGHWIENYFPIRDASGQVQQLGVIVVEITKEKVLEDKLRRSNHELVRVLDDTQRRIAREIHDSLNQYHVGIKLNLGAILRTADLPPKARRMVSESLALLDESISKTRILSHLLHPASFEGKDFASSAARFVDEFSRFSGIHVSFRLPGHLRLSPRMEAVLFRILQESLTNVQRHSQTPSVQVRLLANQSRATLIVRDFGKGMTAQAVDSFAVGIARAGLGLTIMRERLEELGGQLLLSTSPRGTTVKAVLPRKPVRRGASESQFQQGDN